MNGIHGSTGPPGIWARLAALLVTAVLAGGACESKDSAESGNTNWLRCETSADCGEWVCLCRWCTPLCGGTLDCSQPPGAICVLEDASAPSPDGLAPEAAPDSHTEGGGDPRDAATDTDSGRIPSPDASDGSGVADVVVVGPQVEPPGGPTCDAPDCFDECPTGVPCPTGCCSEAPSTFLAFSTGPQANTLGNWTDLYGTGAGNVYVATAVGGALAPSAWRVGDSAAPLEASDDPVFDAFSTSSEPPLIHDVQVAVDDAQGIVHLVYSGRGSATDDVISPRYARHDSGGWTFHDAPGTLELELDASGAPVVLSGNSLYRRSQGEWDAETLPTSGTARRLVRGPDQALYVLGSGGNIARRAPAGGFSVETVPGGDDPGMLAFGGGAEYVAWVDTSENVHYRRKVGTVWSPPHVAFSGRAFGFTIMEAQMAVDAFGLPHFFFWVDVTPSRNGQVFANVYARWTSAGWRFVMLGGCSFGDGTSMTLTEDEVYVSSWDCGTRVHGFPVGDRIDAGAADGG